MFDAHGGFYFTDLGKRRQREMDYGAVFYAKADGSLIREVVFPMVTPNGIGLSPDGSTLYVAETEAARLWAFDIRSPGCSPAQPWPSPHGGRLLAQPGGTTSASTRSRSRRTATSASRRSRMAASRSSRPTARAIEHVPMPDMLTTNICFGGPDLRTAYVTLSGSGRLVAFAWPRPGLALNYLDQRD